MVFAKFKTGLIKLQVGQEHKRNEVSLLLIKVGWILVF
jgi:hypothetical protein